MTRRFVLATANPDKAAEVRAILEASLGGGLELLERPAGVAEVEESGDTLEENARLKAAALVAATGLGAIADDTGLEVASLGGAPGVRSARYAGEDATYDENVTKLLEALEGRSQREAVFSTVALARFPDGDEVAVRGEVIGQITTSRRGGGGFGYDPVFAPEEGDGRTFAEMSPEEKNAISHRGRAFRLLAKRLRERSE